MHYRHLAIAVTFAAALAPPSLAQYASIPTNLSASDYVKMTADMNNFEVQSSRIAATKSRREDVKGFAKQLVSDHAAQEKSLEAALTNENRKITAPSTKLSGPNQAKLDLLRKAPKASFDRIYLQQQQEAHRAALDLQQNYAATGADPSLKQVATAAVPVLRQHHSALAGLAGGAM